MKILQHTLLSLLFSCSSGFAVEPDIELKDFVFPLPERFAESAHEDSIGRGREVAFIFKMNGISVPLGGKIEIDAANESLRVRLPRAEALKVVELINYSIVQSPTKFFRGIFEQPNPVAAELNLRQQFPVPPSHIAQKRIGIHIENRAGDKVTCLIVNNSDHPIKFRGSLDSPEYRMQVLTDRKWTEREIVGDCGIPGPPIILSFFRTAPVDSTWFCRRRKCLHESVSHCWMMFPSSSFKTQSGPVRSRRTDANNSWRTNRP